MSDIFISYSSKDKEKADQLSELLRSAGLSVWIDRQGIVGAEKWATEIVEGIKACSTFILLLSSHSIESENVLRELSLASEKNKRVLPVDLEPTILPSSFEYPLAGLQRVAITDFDKIVHSHKHGVEKIIKKDDRKSLMILPFEDLSPTGDNGWFADGIVSELISALSNVKSIRIADNQATKEFKKYNGQLTTYAREMNFRYFVQGDVRKFGDNIKISARLLDIESGDYLWQNSLRGTMEDIFDIQETVARKVTDGLNIILTAEEAKKVAKKPTENAEAYELFLKGLEYFGRQTKSDCERALSLFEETILLDQNFAQAHAAIANASQSLYRLYDRNPDLLIRAEQASQRVKELEGESAQYFGLKSFLSLRQSDAESALRYAKRSVEIDPVFADAYDALGFAYQALGMKQEAAETMKEYVRLRENNRTAHFNLNLALHELGNESELAEAAERALPIFKRHVRLNPDDYQARVSLATILGYLGRADDSLAETEKLTAIESLDGFACYNLACIYLTRNMPERGMELLRRAVQKGFHEIELFRRDPDLAPLRGTPEFEDLINSITN